MDWGTAITGLGSVAVALIGGYFLFRGKRVEQETEETKAEAAASTAFLQGQTAFQEYVDGVVERRVSAAIAGMQQQMSDLKTDMSQMRRESHEMNDAIRSRETQLWLWNVRSRIGPMPELPEPILERLGLAYLSNLDDLADTEQVTIESEQP